MSQAQSFPSSRKISPSVRIMEQDFSAYRTGIGLNKTAFVGFFQKGPIGVPVRVTSREDFFRIYGMPNPKFEGLAPYAIHDFFREGAEAVVVRAGQDDPGSIDFARTAYVDIPSGGVHAQLLTGAREDDWGGSGHMLISDRFIRLRINNTTYVRELRIPKEIIFSSLTNAAGYSPTSLESVLAAQLKDEDGFTITNVLDDPGDPATARLAFRSRINGDHSAIEIVSSRYNLYSSDATAIDAITSPDTITAYSSNTVDADVATADLSLGIGAGMTRVIKTGTTDNYNTSSPGAWNMGGHRNLYVDIMIWGTGDPTVDGQIQRVYLPADANGDNLASVDLNGMIAWLNGTDPVSPNVNNRGFFFVANASGNITVQAGYPADGALPDTSGDIGPSVPFDIDAMQAWYLTGSDAKIVIRPSSGLGSEVLGFTDTTVARGSDPLPYTDIGGNTPPDAEKIISNKVVGSDLAPNDAYPTFRVWASTPGTEGNETQVDITINPETSRLNITVLHHGQVVERLDGLHKQEDIEGDYARRFYIERYVNGFSDYISVDDQTAVEDLPRPGTYILGSKETDFPPLWAGTDGVPADPGDQAPLLIAGLNTLSDPERVDIDLVCCPGVSTTSVVNRMRYVCEEQRMDCMFILDPPMGMTPLEVRKWHMGQHPLNSVKFDTSYGALYWPWLQVEDVYNQVDIWVPPSGSVLAVYARTDAVAFPWFAPAGLTRGRLPWVKDVEYIAWLAERDSMYADDNAVNVITFLPGEDATVFGQKTLQRFASALDRVNVRRMMIYAEKTIRKQARMLIFEPHDDTIQQNMVTLASGIIGEIVTNRGAYGFIVICDDTINTNEVKDRNELRCRIGIQPMKAVEFIFITFTIHRTGSFEVSSIGPVPTRVR